MAKGRGIANAFDGFDVVTFVSKDNDKTPIERLELVFRLYPEDLLCAFDHN